LAKTQDPKPRKKLIPHPKNLAEGATSPKDGVSQNQAPRTTETEKTCKVSTHKKQQKAPHCIKVFFEQAKGLKPR
jgi:hypothetical protein